MKIKHLTSFFALTVAAVGGLAFLSACGGGSSASNSAETIRVEKPTDEKSPETYGEQPDTGLVAKALNEAKVVNLTPADFYNQVAAADSPYKYLGDEVAILDLWAPWCGPCRNLAPVLHDVADNTGITIYKVNIDDAEEIAQMYGIQYIPQLYICSGGKITAIENQGENYSYDNLVKLVKTHKAVKKLNNKPARNTSTI